MRMLFKEQNRAQIAFFIHSHVNLLLLNFLHLFVCFRSILCLFAIITIIITNSQSIV